jgi:hypothetical protein
MRGACGETGANAGTVCKMPAALRQADRRSRRRSSRRTMAQRTGVGVATAVFFAAATRARRSRAARRGSEATRARAHSAARCISKSSSALATTAPSGVKAAERRAGASKRVTAPAPQSETTTQTPPRSLQAKRALMAGVISCSEKRRRGPLRQWLSDQVTGPCDERRSTCCERNRPGTPMEGPDSP